MLGGVYTLLAICGLVLTGLILFGIAWLFERVIEFAAKLFEDEAREAANAERIWVEVVRLPHEMRAGGQNLLTAGGVADTEHDRPSLTRNTHVLLSGPLNGTEA
jgi:hypothetical protein